MLDATYVASAALGWGLDGGNYCNTSDAAWEKVWAPQLMNLTFGVDRKGAYLTNTKYAKGSYPYKVYRACSN